MFVTRGCENVPSHLFCHKERYSPKIVLSQFSYSINSMLWRLSSLDSSQGDFLAPESEMFVDESFKTSTVSPFPLPPNFPVPKFLSQSE